MARASELAEVQRLFVQAQPALQHFPNVVSVGVGFRKRKGKSTGEPSFVVGVTKKLDRTKRPLPSRLLGVRVDVQVVRKPKLLVALNSAGQIRAQGRAEEGQIGMLADSPDGPCAVTALHVLLTEHVGIDVPNSPYKNTIVEGRNLGDGYSPIGQLTKGAFGSHEDIALIPLSSSVEPSDVLGDTDIELAAPVPIDQNLFGERVQLEVPGDAHVTGVLLEWPVSGPFNTASGPAMFFNLAKFELSGRFVRPGWSGSAIFLRETHEPLALLSFGSNASADGSTPPFAYGFPLASHWEAWGLSPLSRN